MKNSIIRPDSKLIDKYVAEHLDSEFERVQQYDYVQLLLMPTAQQCVNELITLRDTDKSATCSRLVKMFHVSRHFAHRAGTLSPYEGWEEIKNDKQKFEQLLRNRLAYNDTFARSGIPDVIPLHAYAGGLTVTRSYPEVSYFKPALAKRLIRTYLNKCATVFDPFSGYSGRMLGALACNKTYVGSDISEHVISESEAMLQFLQENIAALPDVYLDVADVTTSNAEGYDCLFTCPPYEDIEQWPGVDLQNKTCDEWIEVCLDRCKCKEYLFVVDNKLSGKYSKYVVERISNRSHFGQNYENVVFIR